MNPDFADRYVQENKDRIFRLFSVYQMIEMSLFAKLYFPEKKELEELTKEINKKTLGSMLSKYNKKYPGDPYELSALLDACREDRNIFMHSFWIVLAWFGNKDDGLEHCDLFLRSFEANAEKLFTRITKLNLD